MRSYKYYIIYVLTNNSYILGQPGEGRGTRTKIEERWGRCNIVGDKNGGTVVDGMEGVVGGGAGDFGVKWEGRGAEVGGDAQRIRKVGEDELNDGGGGLIRKISDLS